MSSCNLSAVVRLCYILCLFLIPFMFFYMFVVPETFAPPHCNVTLQAQTVLSDGEEKEKMVKMHVSSSVLSHVVVTQRLVVNVLFH